MDHASMELLKTICRCDQATIKDALKRLLKNLYPEKNIHDDEHYLYAEGTIPVALVAHMDTVFPEPPKNFFYDQDARILWSPEGLGADDRAGIFAIVSILSIFGKEGSFDCPLPSVIFCCDEERGGIGALHFAGSIPKPLANEGFLIELDRAGTQDAVYYGCKNKGFENFISSYGFETEVGTFSDISFIAPVWKIACVNLSVGYEYEHSYSEYLSTDTLQRTIFKVTDIIEDIRDEGTRYFAYREGEETNG